MTLLKLCNMIAASTSKHDRLMVRMRVCVVWKIRKLINTAITCNCQCQLPAPIGIKVRKTRRVSSRVCSSSLLQLSTPPPPLPLEPSADSHFSNREQIFTMSSIVDAVIRSDNLISSDPAQIAEHDRQKRLERQRLGMGSSRPRSSSRPRGPPSESAGAQSDIGSMLDDEVMAAQALRRKRGGAGQRSDIPRMVDSIGENVARRFEDFLEK